MMGHNVPLPSDATESKVQVCLVFVHNHAWKSNGIFRPNARVIRSATRGRPCAALLPKAPTRLLLDTKTDVAKLSVQRPPVDP